MNRKEITYGLNFIVGAFYCIINRPHFESIEIILNKEDSERTIKYFMNDGKVIPFSRVGFLTKYYNKEGLGTFKERIVPAVLAANKLFEAYPNFGYVKTRKNKMTEFVFYKKPKK